MSPAGLLNPAKGISGMAFFSSRPRIAVIGAGIIGLDDENARLAHAPSCGWAARCSSTAINSAM
jgi:hypothetical protein